MCARCNFSICIISPSANVTSRRLVQIDIPVTSEDGLHERVKVLLTLTD